MPDRVRRELRRDHDIDGTAVRLLEVEQPPQEGLRQHALARVPLERNGHELRLVAALAQLVDQALAEDLGASTDERHLGQADGDPHVRATIA